jgi:hypothetical protein
MEDSNSVHHIPNIATDTVVAANTTFRAKTLREQQAVLSLQALAQQDNASEKVHGNQIADLTDKLILGAGEDVIDLAEIDEREQLEMLQDLIMTRLSILRGGAQRSSKTARNGREMLVVNGSGTRPKSQNRRGISKSKSKSRERRETSRGRT